VRSSAAPPHRTATDDTRSRIAKCVCQCNGGPTAYLQELSLSWLTTPASAVEQLSRSMAHGVSHMPLTWSTSKCAYGA